MNLKRAALAIWILLHLALIGVYFEVRGVELRYKLVEKRQRLQAAALERRGTQLAVQSAREPAALAKRARAMGIESKPSGDSVVAIARTARRRP